MATTIEYLQNLINQIGDCDDKTSPLYHILQNTIKELEDLKKKQEEKTKALPKFVIEEDEAPPDRLIDELNKSGIDKLVNILKTEFKRKITNIKNCDIPLEKRKSLIINKILELTNYEISQKILETYFKPKEKKTKEVSWLNDFTIGEEVLAYAYIDKNKYGYFGRKTYRLGKVLKINKSSISVKLYGYRRIDDPKASLEQTHGVDRLIWDKSFYTETTPFHMRRYLIKKGEEGRYRDEEFIEGKVNVDYGN